MIKRAVTGYLIQWSSRSWYDILFLCNYAAPTAPHVFIASSTHVKLKSSLCTWYLIIACCTTVHNEKMSKPVIYSTSSSNRCAATTEHSCTYADTRGQEFEYWIWMGTFSSLSMPQLAFCAPPFVTVKGICHTRALPAKAELKANVCAPKIFTGKHPNYIAKICLLLYELKLLLVYLPLTAFWGSWFAQTLFSMSVNCYAIVYIKDSTETIQLHNLST